MTRPGGLLAIAAVGAVGAAGWVSAGVTRLERRGLARRLTEACQEAGTDLLTGIPNRAGLNTAAAGMTGPVLVAYLDLDGFKPVNDTHGHHTGDALLVAFAGRLAALAALHHGTAARLGGDEFALLIPCPDPCTAEVAAASVTAGVARLLADPFAVAGLRLHLGASVGTATGQPEDLPGLLAAADHAMYAAKHTAKPLAKHHRPRPQSEQSPQDLTTHRRRGDALERSTN